MNNMADKYIKTSPLQTCLMLGGDLFLCLFPLVSLGMYMYNLANYIKCLFSNKIIAVRGRTEGRQEGMMAFLVSQIV